MENGIFTFFMLIFIHLASYSVVYAEEVFIVSHCICVYVFFSVTVQYCDHSITLYCVLSTVISSKFNVSFCLD